MSWLAEILRKKHRECAVCRMGPTHVYDPEPDSRAGGQDEFREQTGTPLCTSCLGARLAEDLAAFAGSSILFEPSLGPDALIYRRLDGEPARGWSARCVSAAREALGRIEAGCVTCGQGGRYLWVPADNDANLWGEDWLAALADGTLSPEGTLCGRCAATRLTRSIEERGLCFEAIVPPAGDGDGDAGSGVLVGS